MLDLVVLDEARDELRDAEAFYESQHTGLGSDFVDSIGLTIDRVIEHPNLASYHPMVGTATGARCARVNRFPYSVVYVEHEATIWVVAFAHDRRRPDYWRHRGIPS